MKHYTYILYNKAAAVAFTLLLLLLSPSCSKESGSGTSDLPDEPQLCTVTISLQAPNSLRPITRASGEEVSTDWATKEEESAYERNISDWIVVAYDENGTYAGHLLGNLYNSDDEDSQTSLEMQLPTGRYNFYAFANLGSLESGDDIKDNIINPEKGEAYIKDLTVNVGDLSAKFNTPTSEAKQLIPMSSYAQEQAITQDSQLEIPLIRMIGKVKVTISNSLDQAITVKNLTLGKFRRNGLINFLPWGENKYLEFNGVNYPNKNQGPPFESDDYAETSYSYVLLDDQGEEIAKDAETQSYSCYVEETLFTKLNETKGLLLNLDIEGRETIERETNFDFVRRNDLLEIPLMVTELDGTITIGDMRLPIGVFPTKYEFGVGSSIQILTPITHYLQSAGDLVINYALSDPVSGKVWKIKYKENPANPETEKFSNYMLIPAHFGSGNLLLDRETNTELTQSKTIYTFDNPAVSEVGSAADKSKSGSFTIRTQELAKTASATIKLTLIVEYGKNENESFTKEGEIEIPYTINITNAPESTTDEGGETTTKGGKA